MLDRDEGACVDNSLSLSLCLSVSLSLSLSHSLIHTFQAMTLQTIRSQTMS